MIRRSLWVHLSTHWTQFISWICAHNTLRYELKSKLKEKNFVNESVLNIWSKIMLVFSYFLHYFFLSFDVANLIHVGDGF